jgi:hypothetical protein
VPYEIKHYSTLDVAEIRYHGEVDAADLRAATTEGIKLQRSMGVVRFLVNSEGWEVRATSAEIEEILDHQYRGEGLSRATRIAIILPRTQSARKTASFFEQACRDRGWNAQICADRAAAMEWLSSTARSRDA